MEHAHHGVRSVQAGARRPTSAHQRHTVPEDIDSYPVECRWLETRPTSGMCVCVCVCYVDDETRRRVLDDMGFEWRLTTTFCFSTGQTTGGAL